MKGSTRGVGAESLDSRAAPLAISLVSPLRSVATAVGQNFFAQRKNDRHGEVGSALFQRADRDVGFGDTALFLSEQHAGLGRVRERFEGGVRVTSPLRVLVLEFGGDHGLD